MTPTDPVTTQADSPKISETAKEYAKALCRHLCDSQPRNYYDETAEEIQEAIDSTTAPLLERIKELESALKEAGIRDGNWIDKWGCCRVCDGEIPDGHTDDCDIYKLEQDARRLEYMLKQDFRVGGYPQPWTYLRDRAAIDAAMTSTKGAT